MIATIRKHLKFWLHSYVPGFAGRIQYHGITLYAAPGSIGLWAVCAIGGFEFEIGDLLHRYVRPSTTMFDVGANIGLLSIPVLRAHPDVRVVSFEPSPTSLPSLTRTARESEFRDRWIVSGKALSDAAGELPFTAGSPWDSFYEGLGPRAMAGGRSVSVPVSTLDAEWVALGRPEISVVKIDVEGAEGRVLAGGAELFRTCHPALVLEWHAPYLKLFETPAGELLEFAEQHGYRVFSIPGGVPIADATALDVQMARCQNYLLISEAVK